MRALQRAGTAVCEPMDQVRLELPVASASGVLALLGKWGAGARAPVQQGEYVTLDLTLPAFQAQELQRRLPGLTGGEGVAESGFGGYHRVRGDPPRRGRTRPDPLNREDYLRRL